MESEIIPFTCMDDDIMGFSGWAATREGLEEGGSISVSAGGLREETIWEGIEELGGRVWMEPLRA